MIEGDRSRGGSFRAPLRRVAVVAAALGCAAWCGVACREKPRADSTTPRAGAGVARARPVTHPPFLDPEPALPLSKSVEIDPAVFRAAMARVEEARGSRGRTNVPPELKQYEDSRRFLAVQMADGGSEDLPADQAELAGMVLRGELAELSPMTEDYLLRDPGTDVQEDPLSHFDVESGSDVRLFPSLEAWEGGKARLEEAARGRGRDARRALAELDAAERWYSDPARRQRLFGEHANVTALASDWGGACYDLTDAADRARFQTRLMSCVRPGAAAVLTALAREYRQRFARLLPVTSLARTQRYQRHLRRVNRNATRVEVPPHTTGRAFDISYRFMASDEQNFLLDRVARLKIGGRVEALRERQNSLHVYVFRHGPPPESAVQSCLALVDAARAPGPGARAKVSRKPGRRHAAARRRRH